VRAIAPGKLLLTGAYAVLEGAPAVVVAVDRYAVADASGTERDPSAEVRAALGQEAAPKIDVRALHDERGRKLGLGSSAAALVASLGVRALARREDLRSPLVRARIFRAARDAHTRAQGGGSGVDVAASVHGGVLRYAIDAGGDALVRALELPAGVQMAVYDSGTSARTSEMRARFERLRAQSDARGLLARLGDRAAQASAAVESGEGQAFVACAREFGGILATLGAAIDAPIVPRSFAELAALAERENAAFLPSGAGGGDVAVWLGFASPSSAFAARASELAIRPLALGIDRGGLRADSPPDDTRGIPWLERPESPVSTK
jgi:phosphomevalonate kinase